jgi:hypothetical protein
LGTPNPIADADRPLAVVDLLDELLAPGEAVVRARTNWTSSDGRADGVIVYSISSPSPV